MRKKVERKKVVRRSIRNVSRWLCDPGNVHMPAEGPEEPPEPDREAGEECATESVAETAALRVIERGKDRQATETRRTETVTETLTQTKTATKTPQRAPPTVPDMELAGPSRETPDHLAARTTLLFTPTSTTGGRSKFPLELESTLKGTLRS